MFLDKAVAGWTGKSDLDHIDTVATYLRSAISSGEGSGGGGTVVYTDTDTTPTTTTPTTSVIPLEGYNVMEKLKGSNYRAGDPLYAIVATKPSLPQRGAV